MLKKRTQGLFLPQKKMSSDCRQVIRRHGARIIGIPYGVTVQFIFPSRCESSLDLKCFEELVTRSHLTLNVLPLYVYIVRDSTRISGGPERASDSLIFSHHYLIYCQITSMLFRGGSTEIKCGVTFDGPSILGCIHVPVNHHPPIIKYRPSSTSCTQKLSRSYQCIL